MRHKVYGKKLGRNHHQRQALFLSQLRAMFKFGTIKTTKAKAKAVRPLITKVILLCQKGDLTSRRRLYAYFQNRQQVNHLVDAISSAFKQQTKNFIKITPFKRRQGDNSLLVKMEFTQPVDLSPPQKPVKEEKKSTTKPTVSKKSSSAKKPVKKEKPKK